MNNRMKYTSMKRIIFIIPLALLIVVGCTKTPLDVAKKNIERGMKTWLKNPSKYESVSWGSLDSGFYKTFYETPRGNQLYDSCFLSMFKDSIPTGNIALLISDKSESVKDDYFDSYLSLGNPGLSKKQRKALRDRYLHPYYNECSAYSHQKPIFSGYTIEHSFRIAGENGQKELVKYIYLLDTNLVGISNVPILPDQNDKENKQ